MLTICVLEETVGQILGVSDPVITLYAMALIANEKKNKNICNNEMSGVQSASNKQPLDQIGKQSKKNANRFKSIISLGTKPIYKNTDILEVSES